ncbi:flagellar hook-length control protein FliK [Clostridium niameyense]|uniref:flagellar hook-length control protein FliK n=1 Tax=Clostridium niameyense TaxID=1622073 RepID=UPI00067E8A75|nr:flagellar hook-length control protein FliK [Clostridium niameyense]
MDIKSINTIINANRINKSNEKITNKECRNTSFNYLLNSRKENSIKNEIPKEKLKEIKNKLQDMGFSKEDVESIKNLDDLKKLVKKSLDDRESKDTEDILLKMIELILKSMNNKLDISKEKLRGNKDINDLLKIMDKDSSNKTYDLLNKLESLLNKFAENQGNDELSKSILEAIQNKLDKLSLEDVTKDDKSTSILENIKNKLNKALSEVDKSSKTQENSLNSLGDKLNKTVKLDNVSSGDSNFKEFNNNPENGEKDFLEGLLKNGEENKDKIDKTINFMANIRQDNKMNPSLSKDASTNIVLNKDTLNNDLIKAIKFMNINDIKDLTVKIMPKELGEVVIKLTMESGIMKANIAATSKETYNLLNANLNHIEDQLQQNNIKVQDVSLNIYDEDTTFFKDGFNQNEGSFNEKQNSKNNRNSINSIDREDDLKDNISNLESNVNMLA